MSSQSLVSDCFDSATITLTLTLLSLSQRPDKKSWFGDTVTQAFGCARTREAGSGTLFSQSQSLFVLEVIGSVCCFIRTYIYIYIYISYSSQLRVVPSYVYMPPLQHGDRWAILRSEEHMSYHILCLAVRKIQKAANEGGSVQSPR